MQAGARHRDEQGVEEIPGDGHPGVVHHRHQVLQIVQRRVLHEEPGRRKVQLVDGLERVADHVNQWDGHENGQNGQKQDIAYITSQAAGTPHAQQLAEKPVDSAARAGQSAAHRAENRPCRVRLFHIGFHVGLHFSGGLATDCRTRCRSFTVFSFEAGGRLPTGRPARAAG